MITCLYVHRVCTGVHRDQKREGDPLELKLQMSVSHPM